MASQTRPNRKRADSGRAPRLCRACSSRPRTAGLDSALVHVRLLAHHAVAHRGMLRRTGSAGREGLLLLLELAKGVIELSPPVLLLALLFHLLLEAGRV